jgi:hypothetical protein
LPTDNKEAGNRLLSLLPAGVHGDMNGNHYFAAKPQSTLTLGKEFA